MKTPHFLGAPARRWLNPYSSTVLARGAGPAKLVISFAVLGLVAGACAVEAPSPVPTVAPPVPPTISAPTPGPTPTATVESITPTPEAQRSSPAPDEPVAPLRPEERSSVQPASSPAAVATPNPAVKTAAEPAPEPAAEDIETPTPSQSDVRNVRLIRSLDTVYYPVTGTTTRDIFDSVEANGPDTGREVQGHFTSGLSESAPSYSFERIDYGDSCGLRSVVITHDLVVTLPQHSSTSSLSALQLGRWREFVSQVAAHEQRHVDIHVERLDSFKSAVEHLSETFSDCDTLGSRLRAVWDQESELDGQQQDAFHEEEELVSQRLRGPVQEQIGANEIALGQLQEELTSTSLEIESLNVEIDDIGRLIEPYDAEIAAVKEQYPDLKLPEGPFREYERVFTERNRLNALRNDAIAELNALVDKHNRTVEEANKLAEQTNRLIDELNWLP